MAHTTAIRQKESAHTLTSELLEKLQQQNSELKEKNDSIIKLDKQLHQLHVRKNNILTVQYKKSAQKNSIIMLKLCQN